MSNKFKNSSYSIQDKWLKEVAPKYFNVDDISMLSAGLFGYVNEVMSNSLEDSIHMQSILSKEIFPNKAILPDSIYAYSSLANYDDFFAKGAVVPLTIAIETEHIKRFSKLNSNSNFLEFFIGKNTVIDVGDKFEFILDYDIKIITRYLNDKTYAMTAQYIMDIPNDMSDINSPFINSVVLSDNNVERMYLNLKGRQLTREIDSFITYSTDVVDTVSYSVEYDGQLAGFNVFYKPSVNSKERYLLKRYMNNGDSAVSAEEKCYFFSMSADNKVNISFSPHPSYFKPTFNSELEVEYYTTMGSEGNFKYVGEPNSVMLKDINGDIEVYAAISCFANVVGDSEGGVDEPSLAEIKANVVKEFSARKNIITESDLQNHFTSLSDKSDIMFLKKRDDVLRRMFSAFVLLRNSRDEVIPTNTVDVRVFQDEFDNFIKGAPRLTLKAGTIFQGCQGTDVFSKVDTKDRNWTDLIQLDSMPSTNYPASIEYPRMNYLYGTPFSISINSNPLFVSYYLTSMYETKLLSYNYSCVDSYEEFIMSNIKFNRNSLKEDAYKVETTINTTVDLDDMFTSYKQGSVSYITGHIEGAPEMRVYGIIQENNKPLGYIKLEPYSYIDRKVTFRASLQTDDQISVGDRINITDSIYIPSKLSESLRASQTVGNNDVKMEIAVYYDGYNAKTKDKYFDVIPGVKDFMLCNVYTTEGNLELFKNLDSIMNSTVSLRVTEKPNRSHDKFYYRISNIPMVRYLYMYDDDNMKEIVENITEIKEAMVNILPDLENNFTVDTKFYNTYGESKFFSVGRQRENLDTTSISINLNIKLITGVSVELSNEIKSFIVSFVETTNDITHNFLYISNLIRELEQNFEEIMYVEFLGFNEYGSHNQIIENNFTNTGSLSKEQIIKFIPEYLNISRHIVLNTGEILFEPRVFINFI